MIKKNILLSGLFTLFLISGLFLAPTKVSADVINPVIHNLGNSAANAENGSIFTGYFITIWRALIVIGVLALLFNLINGAFDWILAGGESAKIQKGRDKMVQSIVGMIILATSFVFITYLSSLLFNFDLLDLTIPNAQTSTSGPAGTAPPDLNVVK